MTAKTINGKKIASKLEKTLKPRVKKLKEKGIKPCLAVILAGEDPASRIYVKKKQESSTRLGIKSKKISLPEQVSEEKLIRQIKKLNSDQRVHGILVQLPLPKGINQTRVIESISPKKDVDGFTSTNLGKLALGIEGFTPCTPKGVIKLIESTGTKFKGTNACIVGHGLTVGLPLSIMLINRNCTLTVCDKFTQNLGQKTSQAKILISCAGVPNLIKKKMVKENAIVIDVGINRVKGKLCGDVDFERVKEKAGHITPVPGGVGPMTVAALMENTVIAAEKGRDKNES